MHDQKKIWDSYVKKPNPYKNNLSDSLKIFIDGELYPMVEQHDVAEQEQYLFLDVY